jgi:hypothetical protein
MAFEGPQVKIPGLSASADLSTHQYKFVKLSGNKTVTVCAATTDKPIGVLQNKPASTQAAEVCCSGVTKLIAGASISAGNSIGTDGAGKGAAYTAADTTKHIVGQVVDGVSNANELATVVIDCVGIRTLA